MISIPTLEFENLHSRDIKVFDLKHKTTISQGRFEKTHKLATILLRLVNMQN